MTSNSDGNCKNVSFWPSYLSRTVISLFQYSEQYFVFVFGLFMVCNLFKSVHVRLKVKKIDTLTSQQVRYVHRKLITIITYGS